MTTMHKATWGAVVMGLVLVGALAGMAVAQGERCDRENPCSRNQCCSKEGYCGCGADYCGVGCQHNCCGCAGCRCDENRPCPDDLCCGKTGTCGCGVQHCGVGCISQCEACKCNEHNPCPNNLCCNGCGLCGNDKEYCGDNCISQCKTSTSATMGSHSGQATYYTKYVPNSCYGSDTKHIPKDHLLAAASSDVFGNKAACGQHYEITCKGAASGGSHPCKKNPTVKVVVVDLCPGCNKNSFDLSKEAFSKIADLDAKRIKIEFKRVSNIAEVV